MSVYRNAGHCIARAMSIETNDGTAKASWQMKYKPPGWPEESATAGSGLAPNDRLTQDSMTRQMLHRELSDQQWHAIVAKFSINDMEVADSVRWLIPRVTSPAHHLFVTKAVTAWAVPRRLPEGFYVLHSWDNDGTPERTLRRWRALINRWLNDRVDEAHKRIEILLKESGLLIDEAA